MPRGGKRQRCVRPRCLGRERLDNPKLARRPRTRLVHVAVRIGTTRRKRSPAHACCKDGEKQCSKREFQRTLSLKSTSSARTPSRQPIFFPCARERGSNFTGSS